MPVQYLGPLPGHGRFDYRPITRRPAYRWPNGAGLAVYLGFNIEHFAFGEGLGAAIGPVSAQPDVLNYNWRAGRQRSDIDAVGDPSARHLRALIQASTQTSV